MPDWLQDFFKWYWENKEYTLPATLAFVGDLYFKWHTMVWNAIKNKFLKKESKKSNYFLYKEGVQRQRQQILQESLYIWENSEYENTKELYEKIYISNIPIKSLGNEKKRLFLVRKNRGVAILGKAGAGKSTYLRYIFLKHTSRHYMLIYKVMNRRYYFYKVREFLKDSKQLSYLENDSKNARGKFILLDGLDEIDADDYEKMAQLIKKIFELGYTIILSCRKDVYEVIKRIEPEIFSLINYHCEIEDWGLEQSNDYITRYSKLHPESNIVSLIEPYQDNNNYSDFFKTPLELSLLVYILERSENSLEDEKIIANRADLYDKFIRIWLQREVVRRGDNKLGKELEINVIIDLWSTIAFYLMKNSNKKALDINNQEIKKYVQRDHRLKKYIDGIIKVEYKNNRKYIKGFSHLRVTEYLAATYFCIHTLKFDDQIIQAVLFEYTHPVTSFIQEKFSLLEHNDLEKVFWGLVTILLNTNPYRMGTTLAQYKQSIDSSLKKQIRNLSEEEIRTIKNQIIYFISRIPNIDNCLLAAGNQVIKEVYEKEQDKFNKRSAAIGAAILGNSAIKLQYAKELLEDAESNLRDRSFTMVYYQDVKDKNPFLYTDDGVAQWDNSRASRLERLCSKNEKSVRLRIFDLITIYNFTQSRINTFFPDQQELDIIYNCEIDLPLYCDEEKELLRNVKEDLIRLWESLM